MCGVLDHCLDGFRDDLCPLLQMQTSREQRQNVLLESYFSLELRHGCETIALSLFQ
jgi:hypothetical protein